MGAVCEYQSRQDVIHGKGRCHTIEGDSDYIRSNTQKIEEGVGS